MGGPESKVGGLVVAAGRSQRMGGVDKIFAKVNGQPLLAWVVDVFQRCSLIDEVVLVLGRGNLRRGKELVKDYAWFKVTDVCSGGERRQDSVFQGLKRLAGCEWVVIHDGSRPCLSASLIERGLAEAREGGAAIAAVPAKNTIKVIGHDGFVRETPDRSLLWEVQTPQVFRYDIVSEAHRQVREEVTDDAALVEKMGHRVKVFMGSYDNIKVTTSEDLALAEVLLRKG